MSHDQDGPAIIVKDVKKSFRIPLDKSSGIKQLVVNTFKRKKGYREFTALNGVSFEVQKGEFFGIVGRNGSGKSTLLKMLAGVYTPDSGAIAVNGSLTPFIELGVGFNPELTGRENVFLNGALLGFSRDEMEKMYDDIVDFAELHEFMEERLKNYSSGMQVRLAFSIAIRAKSDILLLDEVLAVGDEAFQKKCFAYFADLKRDNRTVVLVSHDMEAVKRFCNRAVLLKNGSLVKEGNTAAVAKMYTDLNITAVAASKNKTNGNSRKIETLSTYPVDIKHRLIDNQGKSTKVYRQEETIRLSLEISLKKENIDIENAEVGISISDKSGHVLYIDSTTRKEMSGIFLSKSKKSVEMEFELYNVFGEGEYTITVAVLDLLKKETYGRLDNVIMFSSLSTEKAGWLLKSPSKIHYLE